MFCVMDLLNKLQLRETMTILEAEVGMVGFSIAGYFRIVRTYF